MVLCGPLLLDSLSFVGVLIASFVIQLPKSILKWYYLVTAILIVLVACIRLGYNRRVIMVVEYCKALGKYNDVKIVTHCNTIP